MNISNTAPRSQLNPSPAANDNAALPPPAAIHPPVSSNQQPSGAQASRAAEAARNRLMGNHPPAISAELRRRLDVVRSSEGTANAFVNLGVAMTTNEHFDVNGVWMTRQDCYRKAIELDRHNAAAFNNLGTTLSAGECVDVNGVLMTRQECYCKAVALEPLCAGAFFCLGSMLSAYERIDVNGVLMTKQECYCKAVELGPPHLSASALIGLGNMQSADGSIDVNGVPMSQKQCYCKALEYNLHYANAFSCLGISLSEAENINVNGESMTKVQCFRMAAELDSQNAIYFINLGIALGASGSIDVNGASMTKQQCCRRAAQLDPHSALAFLTLGSALSATGSIDVNGESMTQQKCQSRAVALDPRNALAFYYLGTTLNTGETIDFDGASMTNRDCYQRALEIEPGGTLAQNALQRLDRAEATAGAAETIALTNLQHAAEDIHRRADHPDRVESRIDAPVMPARSAAQRGLDAAEQNDSAAERAGGIDHGADTDWQNPDLPLTPDELAEAMQLQQLSDALQLFTETDHAPGASPMPSDLSLLPTPSALPPPPRAAAWAAAPATLVRQDWTFAPTEELADSFNTFQARLVETAEYGSEQLRPALIGRVNALVTAMRESPELRRTCFALAHEAINGCGDAITLGLNQLALAKINHDVELGGDDVNQLHELGEGFFKLHVLNELVDTEISRRQAAGIAMDEVEIRLAYQVSLRSRLDLPGVSHAMLFARLADVTQETIDAAGAEVERRAQGSASVEYLVQWTPWQQLMERANPQAYAAVRRLHQDDRDAIALQPPRTTEAEWLGTLSAQTAREKTDIERVTRRLTWAILEENLEPS